MVIIASPETVEYRLLILFSVFSCVPAIELGGHSSCSIFFNIKQLRLLSH